MSIKTNTFMMNIMLNAFGFIRSRNNIDFKQKIYQCMFREKFIIHLTVVTGIVVLPLFFTSCGEHKEQASDLTDVEITKDTVKSETRINFDLLRVNIPSPGVLTKKISSAKIVYNKTFLLPAGKRSNYATNYQKAIGMGAFGADIGVAAAHNQSQDALAYLGEISKLATELGVNSAFDPEFSQKIISNISKPDTFQLMLDKAFDKAERNLRSNQRVATTILMIAGGWVEGLYTSIESLNANPDAGNAKDLCNEISVHCYAVDYIYQLLLAYKNNADCAKLLQEMESSKTTLMGYGKTGWDSTALPKLREIVSVLRNKITA
ncbi:MAG: hypothetical protein HY840_04745 [Bacteroidetes bacterium]|nr:hypothetical protein [Bacteroidota bacterium]